MNDFELKVIIILMLLGMILSLVYLILTNRFIKLLKTENPRVWSEFGKPKDGFSQGIGTTKNWHNFLMKKEFSNLENKELVSLGRV